MRVGILIKKPESTIFENGCLQQSLFVYQTLQNFKNIDVDFITGCKNYNLFEYTNIPIININNSLESLLQFNIIITLSANINQEVVLKYLKDNNIIVIIYNCGNIYYIFQEDIVFNQHNYISSLFNRDLNKYIKEYWVIPNYKNDLDFYKKIYDTFSRSIPYVWNTTIVDKYSIEQKIDLSYKYYENKPYYILICEPNVNITKTSLIPLIICEEFYNRGNKNIKILSLCKKDTSSFNKFISQLNIFKDNKLETYPRMCLLDVLNQLRQQCINVIVLSHHNNNPLNFMHLEMCYLNYPLIHNSEPIKQAGYYYKDIDQAVNLIDNAINFHHLDVFQKEYKENSQKMLHVFHPENFKNKQIYESALIKAFNQTFKSIVLCFLGDDAYSVNIWKEITLPILQALKQLDYNVKIEIFNGNNISYNDDNLYIIFGYHQFNSFPKKYIIYQSERICARWTFLDKPEKDKFMNIYKGSIRIWDYSISNIKYLKDLSLLNTNYVPFYDLPSNVKKYNLKYNRPRDINVLWLGNIYGRRIQILDSITNRIPELKKIHNNAFGKIKINLLLRTKIYINICGDTPVNSPLNMFKLKYALLTKTLIISEMTCDTEIYEYFKDVIIFVKNTDEMTQKIEYYLNNDKERIILTDLAYKKYNLFNLSDYIPSQII